MTAVADTAVDALGRHHDGHPGIDGFLYRQVHCLFVAEARASITMPLNFCPGNSR
jgi:hypothetical protein